MEKGGTAGVERFERIYQEAIECPCAGAVECTAECAAEFSTGSLSSLRSQLPLDRFYFHPPLGWHHSKSEIENKVYQQGVMPYLVLDTGSICRYKCKLCYTRSNESDRTTKYPHPLSLEQKMDIMSVAREELGTETLIIEGAGEPSLNSETVPLLEHAVAIGLRAIVFNSGIKLERILPLIIESGGSVGLKFHGLPPEMTPEVYNSILGQADAWLHFERALELIFEEHKLNQPVFTSSGELLAMTRVVLDNYVTPQGRSALLPSLRWAYSHNCAIVLAGDIPSKKAENALEFVPPQEFSEIVLQARFFNWVRGWVPPGRAHLASECEQKYGLRITDGLADSNRVVAGNVYGCVGEAEPFFDIRELHGRELGNAIKRAWKIRRQFISEGCQPRFVALSAFGESPTVARRLYTDPVASDCDTRHKIGPFYNFDQCFSEFWRNFGVDNERPMQGGFLPPSRS